MFHLPPVIVAERLALVATRILQNSFACSQTVRRMFLQVAAKQQIFSFKCLLKTSGSVSVSSLLPAEVYSFRFSSIFDLVWKSSRATASSRRRANAGAETSISNRPASKLHTTRRPRRSRKFLSNHQASPVRRWRPHRAAHRTIPHPHRHRPPFSRPTNRRRPFRRRSTWKKRFLRRSTSAAAPRPAD